MNKLILLAVANLITLQTTECTLIKPIRKHDWSNSSVETIPDPKYNSSLPYGVHKVQQVSVYTRLGKVNLTEYILAYGLKTTAGPIPEDLIHAVTIVHGYAFEFIFDKGIFTTPTPQFLKEEDTFWIDDTFGTRRSKEEVKEWLGRHRNQFKLGSYNIIDNNCFTFIQRFVEFLGGKEPEKYKTLKVWLKRNKEVGRILQRVLEAKLTPADHV